METIILKQFIIFAREHYYPFNLINAYLKNFVYVNLITATLDMY